MDTPNTGFWPFSVAFYARPGAAEACLALQDGFGCDIALVLFGFWRAHRGLSDWAPGDLARAEAALAPVNAALQPLRAARRALKPLGEEDAAVHGLYGEAKALELRLEEVGYAYLAPLARISAAPRHDGSRDGEIAAAAAHLAGCLDRFAPGDEAALQAGAKLLGAAFAA